MTDFVMHVALSDLAHIATGTDGHRVTSVVRAHEQRIKLPPILLRLSRRREAGKYQLCEGHHRLSAARQLGLATIRAMVIGPGGVPYDVAARVYRQMEHQHVEDMRLRRPEWPAQDRRAGRPPPPGFSPSHERPEAPR